MPPDSVPPTERHSAPGSAAPVLPPDVLAAWEDYERCSAEARYAYAQRYNPTGKHLRLASNRIREWAKANGLHVADFGRVPAAVVDSYTQEHGTTR